MGKVFIYHLIGLLSISLLLVPSFQWIASGKELPSYTTSKKGETVTLKEITSFEFDNTIISLYYNQYSGFHFGNQDTPFIHSLKPYCSSDTSTCLYPDTKNRIVMQNNTIIEPWMSINTNESNTTVNIYQLDASIEAILLETSTQPQYSAGCYEKNFCPSENSISIEHIKEFIKDKEEVQYSIIKQYRTQLKTYISINENWTHYQPSTGSTSSFWLSVSHYQIETDKHILCINQGGSDYYLLTDAQWDEFTQIFHSN